jgi:hypothetical protein
MDNASRVRICFEIIVYNLVYIDCCFSWSLTDLQATEVYEYALRLVNPAHLGVRSLHFEMCKLYYAHRLSEYGGFASDSFRYCVQIANAIWDRYGQLQSIDISRLCDLADK